MIDLNKQLKCSISAEKYEILYFELKTKIECIEPLTEVLKRLISAALENPLIASLDKVGVNTDMKISNNSLLNFGNSSKKSCLDKNEVDNLLNKTKENGNEIINYLTGFISKKVGQIMSLLTKYKLDLPYFNQMEHCELFVKNTGIIKDFQKLRELWDCLQKECKYSFVIDELEDFKEIEKEFRKIPFDNKGRIQLAQLFLNNRLNPSEIVSLRKIENRYSDYIFEKKKEEKKQKDLIKSLL